MSMYEYFDNDIEKKHPWWIKLSLGIITVSSITTTTMSILFVSQFIPIAQNISMNAQELLNDIDIDELNLTTQRLIKILDIVCKQLNC